MNFGTWDKKLHRDYDQKKRIESARKASTTPTTVDRDEMFATFKGSGKEPYITTLEECSCRDFFVRRLPCKHIYRLALELEGKATLTGVQ